MRILQETEEWCAEPHIRRPLSELKSIHFQKTVRRYVSYLLANEKINSVVDKPVLEGDVSLDDRPWQWFEVSEILNVSLGPYIDKDLLTPGNLPYVTRTAQNNGVDCYGNCAGAEDEAYDGNCITIGAEGIVAFYQREKFLKGNKINIIRHPGMNPRIGMFLVTVFDFVNVGIYNYGYAIVKKRLNASHIPLPIVQKDASSGVEIDWSFMEIYIEQFMFSRSLDDLTNPM